MRNSFPLSQKYIDFINTTDGVTSDFLEGTTASGKTTVGAGVKFMRMVSASKKKMHLIAAKTVGKAEETIIQKDYGILDIHPECVYYGNGDKENKLPHLKFEDKIIYVLGFDTKDKWQMVLGAQFGCVLIDEINTAEIDMATKDFLSRGLNCIEYKDGRRVNIADYTSMAVRTANQRAFLIGEGERRQRMGVPFIRISQHNTSCPLCKPFERKVLIDDVYSGGKAEDGDYMLLSQAMAQGLFHPRCRHGTATFFPEMEEEFNELGLDYTSPDSRVNEYGSKALNEAHIANMIQRYKRLSLGSCDSENVKKYEERLQYWEERKEESYKIYDNNVDTENIKYYNKGQDNEQFTRYKSVLNGIAPASFEEFQRLKYEFPDEWKALKAKYRIVNQYKVDSGKISPAEILELDSKVITEKRTKFTSKLKKSGNIAGAYIDDNKNNMYFAHSAIDDDSKGYNGSSKLVLLKDNRRFSYIDVPDKNGLMREDTFQDTEAKLFESIADLYERKPFSSITMLSERGMCDSCKGVMEQFKTLYPDVKITVVSNKKTIGNVWKYRR